MAKLIYGLSQTLDGYVDHDKLGPPGPAVFAHFLKRVQGLSGEVLGRRTYEIMSYWNEDQPDWGEQERAFAEAWRRLPKWVASRTLSTVAPGYTLIQGDLGAAVRALKDSLPGEIDVAGPVLAHSLTELGLIDEYRLYFRPFVLGGGAPFFAGPRPPLRLIASDPIGEDVLRLSYVPA